MGTRIATIRAQVTAKDLSWSDTMRRIREETKRTSDFIGKLGDGGMGGLGGLVPTLDVGNIISRGFGLVTQAYQELARARENAEIKADKADLLGLTMSELQGLSVGAAMANTEFETVAGATAKFIKKLSEAADGSKEARADLALLGLTIADFAGLTTADSLRIVADRLSQIRNAGDRANAAMSLFGREAGGKMVTVLSGGSAAFDDYIRRARELGIVLSDAEVSLVRFYNTQEDLNKLVAESVNERASVVFSQEMGIGKGLFAQVKDFAAQSFAVGVEAIAAIGAKMIEGGDLNAIFAEGLRRRGMLPASGGGSGPSPVVNGVFGFDPFADLNREVQEWDQRLSDGLSNAAKRTEQFIEQDWQDWIGEQQSAVKAMSVGNGLFVDLTEVYEIVNKQLEEDKKTLEDQLTRDAEDIAREQLRLEESRNAASASLAPALRPGSADAAAALNAARREQLRLSSGGGNSIEAQAAQRLKDNQKMEQLTREALNVLKSIQRNTANSGVSGLSL